MRTALLIALLTLAACQSAPASPTAPPPPTRAPAALAVEAYLRAKVAGDRDGVRAGLCSEMEDALERESLSFSGVEARIEGMVCEANADSTVVTCAGSIIATYGGENRPIPLGAYRVVEEDGVWRWCGEAG
jgi:hypothetical protein